MRYPKSLRFRSGPRYVRQALSRSVDLISTKPKVTGSNPVGRAHRRPWIPLNGAKSCGAGEFCPIRSKPPFLSSGRIGLSLKQARGLRREFHPPSCGPKASPQQASIARQFLRSTTRLRAELRRARIGGEREPHRHVPTVREPNASERRAEQPPDMGRCGVEAQVG